MSDEKIHRLISTEGTKRRVFEMDDGSVIERTNGTAAWRNNNPGNLKFEYANSADKTVNNPRSKEDALKAAQKGYAGVVALDQFGNAIFESVEAGRAAQIKLLEKKHGDKTIPEMLKSYTRPDYSGGVDHEAQAKTIYAEGDRQGVNLRGKKISEMSEKEVAAMADGVAKHEGWKVGETKQVSGPTRDKSEQKTEQQPSATAPKNKEAGLPSHAVFNEAYKHFIDTDQKFEYGRGDKGWVGDGRRRNEGGDGRTDTSRGEQDLDRDGRKGVDCSSLVWRGLKDAGYDVPKTPFGTSYLFNGKVPTDYAKENFDVTSAADARKPNGSLEPGDILMFKSKSGSGQHVGIFKGYTAEGHIQYLGSQVSTGPEMVTIKPGGYWDGKSMEITGALRPKPEFQTKAPLHGNPEGLATPKTTTPDSSKPETAAPVAPAKAAPMADGMLKFGEKGPEVEKAQVLLNRLGYVGADGKPLVVDKEIGKNTLSAVQKFQHDHGIKDSGIIGPKTLAAMETADKQLLTNPSNPNNALYKDVLGKVQAAEAERKIASGPHSEKLAAALTVEAIREGMPKVDRVDLSKDGQSARAVQVTSNEPAADRKTDAISVPQAMKQTVRESSEQAVQVSNNVQVQQQEQQNRTQATPAVGAR